MVLSCQINRTTFYKHFADIYDVRETIEQRFIDNFKQVIAANIKTGEQMKNISTYFPRIISTNDYYFGVLFKSPDRYHTVDRLAKELIAFYRSQMQVDQNEMSDYVLSFFANGLCAILVRWVMGDQRTSPEKLGRMIAQLLNNGVYPALQTYGK